LLRIGGEDYVRAIQASHEDGSLTFFCAIDQGLVLRVGGGESLPVRLANEMCHLESALGELSLVIGFDCILRRLEVLNRGQREDVQRVLSKTPFVGFSTYGEQFNGIHVNQTLTGVAIGVAA
ncbi:MAG: FIST C-terminal domain-containing protein, partial [Phycisphaerales bacterium]|nr:FIST C-terminal domain-containing protein [Phycisphaerales bacterium]